MQKLWDVLKEITFHLVYENYDQVSEKRTCKPTCTAGISFKLAVEDCSYLCSMLKLASNRGIKRSLTMHHEANLKAGVSVSIWMDFD